MCIRDRGLVSVPHPPPSRGRDAFSACRFRWSTRAGLAGARRRSMAVIQDLLRRLGFVKLGRYGLTLTADDRIASTRPTVLDNGAGLRIVGWRDDDLAMTELSPWYPDILAAHRPAQRRVQFPVMPPMPAPAAPRTTAQLPAMQPVISKPSGEAQVAAPAASARVMPVAVAAEAAVDEDDWEWTIALARARAADEPTAAPG